MGRMQLYIVLAFSAVLLAPFTAFSQEETAGAVGIVSVPLANVRTLSGPRSRLATQVLLGDEVRILGKQDYRYQIAIPSQGNREGWIHQEAVRISENAAADDLNQGQPRIVVTSPKARALILDSTGDHKVSLYAGTRLPMLEKNEKGFTVQFPDNSFAIVKPADVSIIKPFTEFFPDKIAKSARRFQGVRHLAGGLTAQGMDTWGLISIAYRMHGIPIERDRSALMARAQVIKRKKRLRPGDIVLFQKKTMGLYVGRGRFVRAAGKRSVRVYSLYRGWFSTNFTQGLRIFDPDKWDKKIPGNMTEAEILYTQNQIASRPLGERIAYWAHRFIGTTYDPDPLGLYVRTNRIEADEKVDCMYHTFRSVELAQSAFPAEAIEKGLSLRFITQGKLEDGLVANYEERYQYGEDMTFSGKWGANITRDLGKTRKIEGSRGRDKVRILPKEELLAEKLQKKLKDGDIIYWVKDPAKRIVGEIVGHLSVVHINANTPHVIHAAGRKKKNWQGTVNGGVVKEIPFTDYVQRMSFIGALVTRFEE